MLTAAFVILALSAGSSLAAPGDYYFPGNGSQIDADTMAQLQEMIENGQLQIASPDEDDDFVVPPDEPADDAQEPADEDEGAEPGEPGDDIVPGDDNGFDVPDEPDNPDNPGDLDNPDDSDNPDNPGTSEETPPNNQPPVDGGTPQAPSSKLPNTGTHLVVIAGIGLSLAVLAFAVRKLAAR